MELFFSESDISEADINQIIRPKRLTYSKHDLGPSTKNIKGAIMMRKDFQVLNSRQEQLQCSLYFPKNDQQSKLLVIYLHGNSGCRLEANPVVSNLIPLGYHVCSYDSSACGLSDGTYVTLGINERDDLHSVINKMKQQCGYTHFILWGRSMGAVTSLMYCLQMQSMYVCAGGQLNNLNGVVGLIIDSAFANFANLTKEIAEKKISSFLVNIGIKHLRNKLKKTLNGLDLFEIDLTNSVQKLKLPAIFAYSEQDTVISPKHTHTLFDNYGGPKLKTQFQGDHNAWRDQNYFQSIINFINNYLRHYKGSENTLHNNENYAAFSKTMTTPFKMNTLQSPVKVNSLGLTSSHQFSQFSTTQQTPQKQNLQTPRDGKSIKTPQSFMKDECFEQYIQQVNQLKGRQLYQSQMNKEKQRAEYTPTSSGTPYNYLSQSIDPNQYYPSPHKLNQNYVIQNPLAYNNKQEVNENYFSTQQQPGSISILKPQGQLNLENSFNHDLNGPTNDLNSSLYQNTPQANQNILNQSFYKIKQQQIQPQPLLLANTNIPINFQSKNIGIYQKSSQPQSTQPQQQQQIISPFVTANNTTSQIRLPSRQDMTKTAIKRSQSTSSFVHPVQQIDNNYLNNLRNMSFVTSANNQVNTNTRYSAVYQQPIKQQMPIRPLQGNFQIANQIQLK